ncbi:hypothetical protein LWI29_023039 [Acer saccharum]|uniref:Uncharacterized protein n=1 Tax=Acer saccharum TaxID=4024 RepID=A0AA39VW18_ACESA|nr:hypothetical protein LWI29_023039 [Acer saccharum]
MLHRNHCNFNWHQTDLFWAKPARVLLSKFVCSYSPGCTVMQNRNIKISFLQANCLAFKVFSFLFFNVVLRQYKSWRSEEIPPCPPLTPTSRLPRSHCPAGVNWTRAGVALLIGTALSSPLAKPPSMYASSKNRSTVASPELIGEEQIPLLLSGTADRQHSATTKTTATTTRNVYMCPTSYSSGYPRHVSDVPNYICPHCRVAMSYEIPLVNSSSSSSSAAANNTSTSSGNGSTGEGGFV